MQYKYFKNLSRIKNYLNSWTISQSVGVFYILYLITIKLSCNKCYNKLIINFKKQK